MTEAVNTIKVRMMCRLPLVPNVFDIKRFLVIVVVANEVNASLLQEFVVVVAGNSRRKKYNVATQIENGARWQAKWHFSLDRTFLIR